MARTCSNINSSNNHEGASAVCASLLLHALLIAVLNTPPALSLLIGKETRFDLFWIVPQGASAPPLAATAAAAEEELAGGVAGKAAPSQAPAVAGQHNAASTEDDEDQSEETEAPSTRTISPSAPLSSRGLSDNVVVAALSPSPALPLRGRGQSDVSASSLTAQKTPTEATAVMSSPRQKLPITDAAAPTSPPMRRGDTHPSPALPLRGRGLADVASASSPKQKLPITDAAAPLSPPLRRGDRGDLPSAPPKQPTVNKPTQAIPAPTSAAAKNETKAKPSEKSPEPRGITIPSLRGDLKMVITGDSGIRLSVFFREYPKARRKTMQSKSEARRVQKVTPVVVQTREETRESVIETAREGIYLFTAEADKGETAKATFTLKIYESGSRERIAAIGSRQIGSKAVLARVLMPEAILWDDDSAFTGSLDDSDSTTKFNAQTGIYWKEYHD